MKVEVTIPDDVYAAGERLAKELGTSRSQVYARALADFVACHKNDSVADRLHRVLDELGTAMEPLRRRVEGAALRGKCSCPDQPPPQNASGPSPGLATTPPAPSRQWEAGADDSGPSMTMDKTDLLDRVRRAFAAVASPGDAWIVFHACDECCAVRDALRDKDPSDVPDALVVSLYDKLPLLTDEAKQFYLPAYLRASVNDPSGIVTEYLLYALESDHGWTSAGGYTQDQVEAVLLYLEFMRAVLPADEFQSELTSATRRWRTQRTEP